MNDKERDRICKELAKELQESWDKEIINHLDILSNLLDNYKYEIDEAMNNCIYIDKWSDIPEKYTGKVYWNGPSHTIWYIVNRQIHRENGPAIIWSNKNYKWYIWGVEYTEKKYWEIMKTSPYATEILSHILGNRNE